MTRIKKIVLATVLAFGAMGSAAAFADERPESMEQAQAQTQQVDYRDGVVRARFGGEMYGRGEYGRGWRERRMEIFRRHHHRRFFRGWEF